MGLDWYIQQMPLSSEHQITIENTPMYFYTNISAKRVFDLNPKMKLILILRDPVMRAVSEYFFLFVKHKEITQRDLDIFKNMVYNIKGEINETSDLVLRGLYYTHLQNWLKYFPKDQILLIDGHEFIRDPSVAMEKLQTFLNLTLVIKKEHFVEDIREGYYCLRMPSNLEEVKCMGKDRGRKLPSINETIINDLRIFYRSSNEMFFKFINETPWWPI